MIVINKGMEASEKKVDNNSMIAIFKGKSWVVKSNKDDYFFRENEVDVKFSLAVALVSRGGCEHDFFGEVFWTFLKYPEGSKKPFVGEDYDVACHDGTTPSCDGCRGYKTDHIRRIIYLDEPVTKKQIKCEKCGRGTFCEHSVVDTGCGFSDAFRLFCPKCGEIDMEFYYATHSDIEDCPYCGKLF